MSPESQSTSYLWKPLMVGAAAVFLYAGVLSKLAMDWWTDENYSHGLLVPAVIVYILWRDSSRLRNAVERPIPAIGLPLLIFAVCVLLAGTLGAELYLQRISLVIFLSGIVICFFGRRVLLNLWVPGLLLLLSIPIPQIIFNKIAFPLQLWASKMAVAFMGLFGVPTTRSGNILELVPMGSTQIVALEVVEACSGIRSLMTLAALALLLAYFTRSKGTVIRSSLRELIRDPFLWRALILVASAVPIALLTNALRVAGTALITYLYGVEAAEGTWHSVSGFGVFAVAFVFLSVISILLLKIFPDASTYPEKIKVVDSVGRIPQQLVLAVFIFTVSTGVLINWLDYRGETVVDRRNLTGFPIYLNGTTMSGSEFRFPAETEQVLGASDYIMRDYRSPSGQRLNLYIGYYRSQRTGATYHSPRNCLPGTGWEMEELEPVMITTASGEGFEANKYLVKRGDYQGLMIYWYQGRGRTNASEYWDKIDTITDSVLENRSDGAMIRIMTSIGNDQEAALEAAIAFSSVIADRLPLYVPD